jgi:hypothetical protein
MNVKINKRNSQPQNISTIKQDSLNIPVIKSRQSVRTSKILDNYKKQKLGLANLNEDEFIPNTEQLEDKKDSKFIFLYFSCEK